MSSVWTDNHPHSPTVVVAYNEEEAQLTMAMVTGQIREYLLEGYRPSVSEIDFDEEEEYMEEWGVEVDKSWYSTAREDSIHRILLHYSDGKAAHVDNPFLLIINKIEGYDVGVGAKHGEKAWPDGLMIDDHPDFAWTICEREVAEDFMKRLLYGKQWVECHEIEEPE
jgi:hypothetical protein